MKTWEETVANDRSNSSPLFLPAKISPEQCKLTWGLSKFRWRQKINSFCRITKCSSLIVSEMLSTGNCTRRCNWALPVSKFNKSAELVFSYYITHLKFIVFHSLKQKGPIFHPKNVTFLLSRRKRYNSKHPEPSLGRKNDFYILLL